MSDLIENICLFFFVICAIGFIISLSINNIVTFFFSVLFMLAFGAIAIIDITRK